ncbi:DUF4198 domain-containing protein [Treponema sp. OMZ 788]|uniref:DUF4198 domain-containing protein n=1 Tax=unclassified Treponema TaxID=2638727 RepID=UPI0020A5394A|nr:MULTISPECIES: DUF4198 domain-containing protein [unclassified Treponema]UTC61799.1 DUF4198 domain-containing protein [Treponema sp. OMZ 787]UTC65185.1 DUF4198 domain-containing protein [Treponema sp. OMZ 788]
MKKITGIVLLLFFVAMASFAHFQMIYTPTSIVEGNSVDFKIVFTHPAESGHTMDIGKNEAGEIKGFEKFFSIHKEKMQDLMPSLKKTQFTTSENTASAYDLTLNKDNGFRGGGDWALIAVPHPYYEGAEDAYIQQITKVFINKAGLDTDWSARCAEGYPEIMPLVKPYDVWVGGIFRGVVVDSKGKPVPNAEIEVEYINFDVDMKASKFGDKAKTEAAATIILADKNGVFSFVPHKAGYWGFAALGAGRAKKFAGKELSQDAVLWIEAMPVK